MPPGTAYVTGASGFVAAELVRQLLAKGYKVRATVRSSPSAPRAAALAAALQKHARDGAQLELLEADILNPASLDLSGVDYVSARGWIVVGLWCICNCCVGGGGVRPKVAAWPSGR